MVRAHVFPLRPTSRKTWQGLLAVSFPVPLGELRGADATREFGATLHRVLESGSDVVHKFDRRVTLSPSGPDVTSEPRITFLEPVDLKPGPYALTVVMSDPAGENPHTARIEVEVPEIPKAELFLAGPMLGKAAGINVVITGGPVPSRDNIGGVDSFEPLLVQQFERPVDLLALTEACVVGGKNKVRARDGEPTAHVDRTLRDGKGEAIGTLPPQGLFPEGEDSVRCENLLDVVPASALRDGEYVFEAVLRPPDGEAHPPRSVRFSIGSPTSLPGIPKSE